MRSIGKMPTSFTTASRYQISVSPVADTLQVFLSVGKNLIFDGKLNFSFFPSQGFPFPRHSWTHLYWLFIELETLSLFLWVVSMIETLWTSSFSFITLRDVSTQKR